MPYIKSRRLLPLAADGVETNFSHISQSAFAILALSKMDWSSDAL
jgi:hypothetical protein